MPVHDTPTRCFYKTKVHVQGIRRRTCDSGFSTQTQNGSLGLDDFRTAGSIWFEKKTDRSTCCMHHIHLPELDDTTSFNINHKSCEIGFRAGNWLVAFHLNGFFLPETIGETKAIISVKLWQTPSHFCDKFVTS